MGADTEIRYQYRGERPELLEPKRWGEHVWIAAVAYRLAPESLRGPVGSSINLDSENIASMSVGCYVCEQPWSERLSYRKCPGEPAGEV